MIISHKYKFIFVKTLKTAGTSIEVFLSQHCGEKDVVTPIIPHVDPHVARNYKGIWNPLPDLISERSKGLRRSMREFFQFKKFYNHIPAVTLKKRISADIWNNYYKFCIERNPWDKTLSHYHMVNARSEDDISLQEYFDRGGFCLNYPHYTDSKGNLLVDRVVKYENLMEELGEVFEQLGIPFSGTLGVKAKSESRSDKKPYQEVLTSDQQKIISEVFAREIKMHNYKFI